MNQMVLAERDAPSTAVPRELEGRKVLIIVENLPVPFDRRVWQEARALTAAGALVSVICPTGRGHVKRYELLDGVHIHRHPMPEEGDGLVGYLCEYSVALFWEFVLACRVFATRGFHVIHGCNPPDLIFLVALPFKLLGRKFIFDHHDINPELYEAKFGKRGLFWRLLILMERLTFMAADVSIATNESYRKIAIERGRMRSDDVFVVRSSPDLARVKPTPPAPKWRNGRTFLVGYVGVMGDQEGIDLLLDAARALVDRGRQDIQFCLVGGGPSLAKLKAQSAQMGLDPYVTFTGSAPDQDLFEVLSTSDVCVNPDRVNPMNDKSTMNKIMEYMAVGKPMIQFETTEGRVSAGESSLYAKANDAADLADNIELLLASPEQRERMGAIGRERVQGKLSWSHQVPKLVDAYKRAFAR